MRRTRRQTTAPSDESSTSTADTTTSEVEHEQSLDEAFRPKPRGQLDRMLRPQRGMDFKPWSGRDHWICPRCKYTTFDKAIAEAHRC